VGRIHDRLEQLYAIGGGPGANRPSGSEEEDAAHELAAGWMREAGLAVEVDADGNLVGRSARRPELWLGSHLDSVPHGGRYDGALGVVAALEAVEAAGAGSAVAFRGEEVGCIGSRALVARGVPFPAAFLELHIEQGPRLADACAPLGLVTGIVGVVRGTLVVEGQPGHAGTVPMDARDDALVKAASEILRIRETAAVIDGVVATVGQIEVEPGAANVIPERVTLTVDARAPDHARADRIVEALGIEPFYRTEPAEMDASLRGLFREELAERGLPLVQLASGAGHDASVLATAGVPAAMLFVRSLNGGVSHSPDELSSHEDVALGVEVLTAALRRLAAS
jgi:acetylornithine deacetylase/succinyl-diaminopimelate desuccinylase-like protein